MTRGFPYQPSHSLHAFQVLCRAQNNDPRLYDAMVDPLDDAFSANVLDAIKGMLADKGLIADFVNRRML